jgi:hypothetical protein
MAVRENNNFFEFYAYQISATIPPVPTNSNVFNRADPLPLALNNGWLDQIPETEEGDRLWVIAAQIPKSDFVNDEVTIQPSDWITITEYNFVDYPAVVDGTLPRAGRDNPSIDLQNNFSATRDSFATAADEIEYLNLRVTFINDRVTTVETTAEAAIPAAEKGTADGVATLDSNGQVPESQLGNAPSGNEFYANLAAFPLTGDSDTVYIAEDTNLLYRWNGTEYTRIASSGALDQQRTIAASGGITWSVSFDGSENVTSTAVVNNITTLGITSPMQVWRGDQTAYNAETKNANILYIVTP